MFISTEYHALFKPLQPQQTIHKSIRTTFPYLWRIVKSIAQRRAIPLPEGSSFSWCCFLCCFFFTQDCLLGCCYSAFHCCVHRHHNYRHGVVLLPVSTANINKNNYVNTVSPSSQPDRPCVIDKYGNPVMGWSWPYIYWLQCLTVQ